MKRTVFDAIECQLCGQKLLRVTNTHLWNKHQMSMEEYMERFPDAPIDAKGLANNRVTHLRDRSYEEVYGPEKAAELKRIRSQDTTSQMEDPEQIQVRQEKCTHKVTDELKQHLSEVRTIHGGTTYRKRALEHYGLECQRCDFTSEEPADFVVHHKDLKNLPSELGNHALDNLMVLCYPCHGILHNELSEVAGQFAGLNHIEKGVHFILIGLRNGLGLDLTDVNFLDTPKRVARAYAEIFKGLKDTNEQITDIFKTSFPSEYDQIVLCKDIEAFSMCPHHLLPVRYSIFVAYLPSEDGQVLGISKLARLVDILARRPVLQETLTKEVTNNLMTKLEGCQGAGCIVKGQHLCMQMRGIQKQNSVMVTSSMEGVFLNDGQARSELMSMIHSR